MKGGNVSEMQRTRKEQRERKACEKALRDSVMTRPATLRRSGYAVSATNRKAWQRPRRTANRCLEQSMISALLPTRSCARVKPPRAAHCKANGFEKRVNHCYVVSHMLTSSSMAGVFQGLKKHWRNTSSLFMRLGPARERGGPQMMLKRR